MPKLKIDNQEVEIEEGATILDAASKAGICIPTLCYHEELSPNGSCRLCTVEVASNGVSSLVAACSYPVEEGLQVKTSSERVVESRKLAVELLLARQPHSVKIQKLAREMGVEQPSFSLEQKECILCELCVRACREVVEVDAIRFIAQGLGRNVAEPSIEVSETTCIGCGSCAYICPTEAITMADIDGTRVIDTPSGKIEHKLRKCPACGNYWIPEKQLEYIAKQSGLSTEELEVCLDCRD